MRIEKTVEVGGKRLRVIARMHTRKDGERVCSVRIYDGLYFRDVVVADSPSFIDEAVEKAVVIFLGTEGSTVMSKQKKTAKVTGKARKSAPASAKATAGKPKRAQGARGAKADVKATKGYQSRAGTRHGATGRARSARDGQGQEDWPAGRRDSGLA